VLQALAGVNRELGTTTVIITHNAAIERMADRVVRFRDGRIDRIDVNLQRADPSEIAW
jgi:putative ABC transport system ATP-binding protein